jgi:hypothetical protein
MQQLKFIIQSYKKLKKRKMRTISRTITLTKAQIDALDSTAIELLEPPVAGKAIVLIGAQLWKTAGNAATAGTGELQLYYTATTGTIAAQFLNVDSSAGALGDNAQNRIQYSGSAGAVTGSVAIPVSADGISIKASAAIVCAASTTAKIKLDFQIIDL